MKNKNIILRLLTILTVLTIIFSSCKKSNINNLNDLTNCKEHIVTACSEDLTKTNLRIKNNSNYNFCNVVLAPSVKQANCGIIKKGESTCYRSFDTAYNYAYVHFFIGDKEFKFVPIDYVGEKPLGVGKFTYLISIPDYNSGKVSITVQKN